MSEDPCASFRAALAAQLSGAGPADFPLDAARHLDACEDCQEQLDGLEKPDDESDEAMLSKMMPIMEALAKLEAEAGPSPEQLAMTEDRAAEKRDIDVITRDFIARHPDLEPSKHGIDMEKYEHGVFFNALQAVNLLMNRALRSSELFPESCGLREDGAVFLDGAVRVPAESVQKEINRFIVGERKDDVTKDSWYDHVTCAKLAGWIVAAVRSKPDIMRNYRMLNVKAPDPRVILLEPIRTGPDEDPLDLWK